MTFVFVDEVPTAPRGVKPKYLDFARALKNRPGEWAIFPKSDFANLHSYANGIRKGDVAGLTRGQFQVKVSGPKIYVRYVGE